MPPEATLISGWGRTAPSSAHVVQPCDPEEVALLLKDSGTQFSQGQGQRPSCIPRGLGRSYGDAAQSAGGVVIDTTHFNEVGPIDPVTGSVRVGGGISLEQLLAQCVPQGWFLAVTPGTRHVSVGGAIAADVHGKNHHLDGGFGNFTDAITLASPTGVRDISPRSDPDLFWATTGGMGLTGVITAASIRLRRIETTSMEVMTRRCSDLSTVMSAMEETDDTSRYSVAWIDTMASGRSLGRSILMQGDHVALDGARPSQPGQPLQPLPRAHLKIPTQAPPGLMNRLSTRAFNEVWYRAAPRHPTKSLEAMASYFYPLDGVGGWNLIYGKRGFVQYQFCVGPEHASVVEGALKMLSGRHIPSFLGVLKRFGPASPGPLSFPRPGWTLAIDFPVGPPELATTLTAIDDLVAEHGGRVYLAKDARLSPSHLRAMYPELPALDAVRRHVDPAGVMGSDLSRRLGLTPSAEL
jgi:decaprenylphospho-beta-D-ribofuranose 2-oxidase